MIDSIKSDWVKLVLRKLSNLMPVSICKYAHQGYVNNSNKNYI